MHVSFARALPPSRATANAKLVFSFGAILLAVTLSSAPAQAQDAANFAGIPVRRSADEAITIIGRAQRAALPSIFGTVAVPFGTTAMSARWTRAISASADDPALIRLTAAARDLAPYQMAAFIQSLVNRGVRNHSRPRCIDDGYWAPAKESLARGMGDCVDIAVAKMEALRQLGFPVRDLYLTTGRTFSGGLEAALLVRIGGQFYLLDTRSEQMSEAGHATSFTPIVTYGVGMTWAHGIPVTSPRTLAKPPAIAQSSDRTDRSPTLSGLDDDWKASIRSLDQRR